MNKKTERKERSSAIRLLGLREVGNKLHLSAKFVRDEIEGGRMDAYYMELQSAKYNLFGRRINVPVMRYFCTSEQVEDYQRKKATHAKAIARYKKSLEYSGAFDRYGLLTK